MPGSNMEDIIRETYALFRSNAEQLAAKFGCTVEGLIYDVTYREPAFVNDKGYAVQRAEELSKTIALTEGHRFGATRFSVVENGSGKGLIGFTPDEAPKVCIVKGIFKVTSEVFEPSYMSMAFFYSLRPNNVNGGLNGSAAPHKP